MTDPVKHVAPGDPTVMRIPVSESGDAVMVVAYPELHWQLRYGDPVKVRYSAAEVIESYEYLLNCTQKERNRRVRIIREQRSRAQ